jgi:hypothetical protein
VLPITEQTKKISERSCGLGLFKISREQLTAHKRFSLEGPLSGAFWLSQMLHKADFFQEQINQCRSLAERASNKNDREFWLKMTHCW